MMWLVAPPKIICRNLFLVKAPLTNRSQPSALAAKRRREFVTLIGVAAAWPIAARVQQGERMRRIGVLTINAEDDPEYRASIAQFVQGLASFGWTEERNIQIDRRYACVYRKLKLGRSGGEVRPGWRVI